jgi:diguanylate cyclase (GGDEF)-like protein/PAS domain S-box-containing protein
MQSEVLREREAGLAQTLRTAEGVSSQLAHDERFIRAISNAAPGLISYLDVELRYRFVNDSHRKWYGKTPEELIGLHVRDVLGEQLFAVIEPYLRKALSGEQQSFERTHSEPDGCTRYVLANYIPDIGPNGRVQGVIVLVTDVTDLKEAELKLRMAASLLENITEGVAVTDMNGLVLSVNPAFSKVTGFSADDVLGRTTRQLSADPGEPDFATQISDELNAAGHWEGEIWCRRKTGDEYLQQRTMSVVRDESGEPVRYISVVRDVTRRWKQDEEVRRRALYDRLTELPNRHLLLERLSQLLSQSSRDGRLVAVMFCDLDGFKAVNDALGHAAGDTVLCSVARRVQAELRKNDTVGRLGGDEFVILLDNPANSEEVENIAQRIIDVIGRPIEIDQRSVHIGVSIGIVTNALVPDTADQLLRRADKAMYATKFAGRNGYRFLEARQDT